MHSLQPQQHAQLRPRGHDENILEEAYRGRYARQRLLNFWPESSCGYHAIKRFVCIIQVIAWEGRRLLSPMIERASGITINLWFRAFRYYQMAILQFPFPAADRRTLLPLRHRNALRSS